MIWQWLTFLGPPCRCRQKYTTEITETFEGVWVVMSMRVALRRQTDKKIVNSPISPE